MKDKVCVSHDEDHSTSTEGDDTWDIRNLLASRPVPNEVTQLILSQCSDAFSLKNLIHSGPIFYRSFQAASSLILQAVLRNEIRPALLLDAFMLYHLAHVDTTDDDSVNACLSRYDDPTSIIPKTWTLRDALILSRARENVEYFAGDFAMKVSSHATIGRQVNGIGKLTLNESDRIARSFYRFEIYHKAFHESTHSPDDQADVFLNRFPIWEREQLASIYESLFQRLSVRKWLCL